MSQHTYSDREIDAKFAGVHEKLDLILKQTTKHNGRLSKVERWLLVVTCITATLFISKPELIKIIYALL